MKPLAAALCCCLLLFPWFIQQLTLPACAADDDFSRRYTQLTKKIMLSGIEMERYSLKYRLANSRQPRFRRLRYFLGQETGAACGLAFEIVDTEETRKGKRNPLKISQPALKRGLTTAMVGSTIAGAGSAFELTANLAHGIKMRKEGYGSKAANEFIASHLKEIDALLAEREALVSSQPNHPAHERAVVEGRVLACMRDAFVQEYAEFYANTKGYHAFQNSFFLLNSGYNAVTAVAAGYGLGGVSQPKYNGTTNILFIVAGAMASASPVISTATGIMVRKCAKRSLQKKLNETPDFKLSDLSEQQRLLEQMLPGAQGSLMPSLPATARAAMYTQSNQLFQKQFNAETRTARHLEKVALQTSELGPVIGSTLMTQGILGTVGVYKYPTRPRKQLALLYDGAIVGTVGTSMAVVGNAAWLLMSWSYERRLKKQNRLPAQLIEQRLQHLDELESTVSAL